MDELEKWAKDKPKSLVILAGVYAMLSDTFYILLKETNKNFNEWGLTDVPPVKIWLKFYKNDRWFFEYLKEIITEEVLDESSLAEYGIGLISQMHQEEDVEISYILDYLKIPPEIQHYILERANKLNPEKVSLDYRNYMDPEFDESKDMSRDPETLFFLRVWLPCWFFYGEEPSKIYKKAIRGDIESVCNLLRVDKAIVNNPKIADIIHKASMDIESDEFRKIGNAFRGTKKFTSKKKLKVRTAALISNTFSKVGIQLNSPEIHKLFDIVSKNMGEDVIEDPDLLLTPHGFYLSLRRNLSFWENS